jgi:hypothetical protein
MKRFYRETGIIAFCLSAAFLAAALIMLLAPGQTVSANTKIGLCHYTGSGKYASVSADISSVEKWQTAGHGAHPNDIWPAFTTEDGVFVPAQGDQAILANGCVVPEAAPTDTTEPPTATTEPPDVPTATNTPQSPEVPTATESIQRYTPTDTPTGTYTPAPTDTPVPVYYVEPTAVYPVVLPVSGVDLGGYTSRLPRALLNAGLVAFGVGLVLTGLARRAK